MKCKIESMISPFVEFCRNSKSISYFLIAFIIAVMLMQVADGIILNKKLIFDRKGNITAIVNKGTDIVSVPVKISGIRGNEKLQKSEILSINKTDRSKQKIVKGGEKDAIEKDINQTRKQIEEMEDKIIYLPSQTESGTRLIWRKNKKCVNPFIPLVYPAVMYVLYSSRISKQKETVKKKHDEIISSLPSFSSQLLLLLNSGLIFPDAVEKIVEGYRIKDKNDFNSLESIITDAYVKSGKTGLTLVKVFEESAHNLRIKELSRFAGIIADNEYKGVSLAEKLQNESELLWEERKKTAEEKGRLAETKLAFPLALLLIVLIMVTAAPAILQI